MMRRTKPFGLELTAERQSPKISPTPLRRLRLYEPETLNNRGIRGLATLPPGSLPPCPAQGRL